MDVPAITCVIPTFNGRDTLPQAVNSVLAQEGADVEVLIVDDCSDGPTRDFIESLASRDARIRVFLMSRNGGQAQARNVGAALARGRFIAFLDQDDEHIPGWYADAIHFLNSAPQFAAVSGTAKVEGMPERLGIPPDDIRLQVLSYTFVTNVVYRTSLFRATGGFPVGPMWRRRIAGEDGTFRHGFVHNLRMAMVDRPALLHRAREGGATVHYFDRTYLVDGIIQYRQRDEVELNGELEAAQGAYWSRFRENVSVVWPCAPDPQQ